MSKMTNFEGIECWTMSSDEYCAASVTNVEKILSDIGLRLPSKCLTPTIHGYRPELDATAELKDKGVTWYQELIGMLR